MVSAIISLQYHVCCHSLACLLDDQWSNIVSCLRVVLGVAAVTVGELLTLPASAEHLLVSHVLDVHVVHHLVAVQLDALVHSVGLHPGQHGELLLDSWSNYWSIGKTLEKIENAKKFEQHFYISSCPNYLMQILNNFLSYEN